MVDHTEKQINALKNASKKKREDTINRVRNALEEMEKNNIPISFRSVSKMANVSRYWGL